jgi:hypothetical protein
MLKHAMMLCALLMPTSLAGAAPETAAPRGSLAQMPIREVTVFKDGHAFVLHEGRVQTAPGGGVLLDYLPSPVLGTFWPYSKDRAVKLSAVTASTRRVSIARTALSIRELLEGNPGAKVTVTEQTGKPYPARIVGVPTRSGEELEETSPPNADPQLPVKGSIILLETTSGVSAVPLDRIRSVAFAGSPNRKSTNEEFRNVLTLKLEWGNRAPAAEAHVGMVYLQKGIRWIPEYRVTLDGKGHATIKLQATLINELADLNDATANLVVGVPTFTFQGTPDPIGLQQSAARLSSSFRRDSETAYAFSNAIMSQSMRMERVADGAAREPSVPPDLGPEVQGSDRTEDLFVFTVKHVTLKKGRRMVLPVTEYTIPYRDVYALDIAFAPPPDARFTAGTREQAEVARLFHSPKVEHRVRLKNGKAYPLTTAPALILRGETLLGQGMMTYTAQGGETDLAITTAPDIRVKHTDRETKRTPNALRWNNNDYGRIDMAGTISLTNYKEQAVEIEATRHVLGITDEVAEGGKAEMASVFEDGGAGGGAARPYWWGWYDWPYGWTYVNGTGCFTWKVSLEPGKSTDLHYVWHYFSR